MQTSFEGQSVVEVGKAEFDLSYLTDRIILLYYSTDSASIATYRAGLQRVSRLLQPKHSGHMLILNLSEPRPDLTATLGRSSLLNAHVVEFGWPADLAMPLERLCSLCRLMEAWLRTHPQNVCMLHALDGRGRLGLIVLAYRIYCSLSSAGEQLALDRYALKKYFDEKLALATTPSQLRYASYLSGLLTGSIRLNPHPLYLHSVTLLGPMPDLDGRGSANLFLKIYQASSCLHTTDIFYLRELHNKLVIPVQPPQEIRGDFFIVAYHRKPKTNARETIFRCQLHTCAIDVLELTLRKNELDFATSDIRFPNETQVQFFFSWSADTVDGRNTSTDLSVERIASGQDTTAQYNSYEELFDAAQYLDAPINSAVSSLIGRPGYKASSSQAFVGGHAATLGPSVVHRSKAELSGGDTEVHVSQSRRITSRVTGSDSYSQLTQLTGRESRTRMSEREPDVRLGGTVPIDGPPTGRPMNNGNGSGPSNLSRSYSEYEFSRNSTLPAQVRGRPAEPAPARSSHPPQAQQPSTLTQLVDIEHELQTLTNSLEATYPSNNGNTGTPSRPPPAAGMPPIVTAGNQTSVKKQASNVATERREQRQVEVTEEVETVSLQPIGRGVVDLDPAGTSPAAPLPSATLSRPASMRRPPNSAAPPGFKMPTHHYSQTLYPSGYPRSSRPPGGPGLGLAPPQSTITRSATTHSLLIQPPPGRPEQPTVFNFPTPRAHTPPTTHHPFSLPPEETTFHVQQQVPVQSQAPPRTPPRQVQRTYGRSPTPTRSMQVDPGLIQLHSIPFEVEPPPTTSNGRGLSYSDGPQGSVGMSQSAYVANSYQSNQVLMSSNYESVQQPSPTAAFAAPAPSLTPAPIPPPRHHTPTPATTMAFGLSNSSTNGGTLATNATSLNGLASGSTSTTSRSWKVQANSPEAWHAAHQQVEAQLEAAMGQFTGHPSLLATHAGAGAQVQSSSTEEQVFAANYSTVNASAPRQKDAVTIASVKALKNWWYKPKMGRDEVIKALLDKPEGTFAVRNSGSFTGSYGLAIKVDTIPANVKSKKGKFEEADYVRHFLLESSKKGIRIKGCTNEPYFEDLEAFVLQHTLMPLGLPCCLVLPTSDSIAETRASLATQESEQVLAAAGLSSLSHEVVRRTERITAAPGTLERGCATNALYLAAIEVGSLSREDAVAQAVKDVKALLQKKSSSLKATTVTFHASLLGITMVDLDKKLFTKKSIPPQAIVFCKYDIIPKKNISDNSLSKDIIKELPSNPKILCLVTRKSLDKGSTNVCYVLLEQAPGSRASKVPLAQVDSYSGAPPAALPDLGALALFVQQCVIPSAGRGSIVATAASN